MSELGKRIASSVVFVVLILGPLFVHELLAFAVYGTLGFLSFLEYRRLFKSGDLNPGWISGAFIYAFVGLWLLGDIAGVMANGWLFIVFGIGVLMLGMVREVFRQPFHPQNISTELFGAIYCSLGFWGMTYFFHYRSDLDTLWLPIAAFSLVWVNDSAAYLFGRAIGKTPLIPRVSPKKTVEGSVSGLIAALGAGALFSLIPNMPSWSYMMGMAAVAVFFGSVGDLFESTMKRHVGVKDSGKFLPGHGGFLDRFDAMLMAVPALIVYFELLLPKP